MTEEIWELPISEKAKYICIANSLHTVEDVITHYINFTEFKDDLYEDEKLNIELKDFSKEILIKILNLLKGKQLIDLVVRNKEEMRLKEIPTGEREHDFPLNLYHFNLSIRATNACNKELLFTLEDIYNFYKTKGRFGFLRNVGEMTNDELIALCKKYD